MFFLFSERCTWRRTAKLFPSRYPSITRSALFCLSSSFPLSGTVPGSVLCLFPHCQVTSLILQAIRVLTANIYEAGMLRVDTHTHTDSMIWCCTNSPASPPTPTQATATPAMTLSFYKSVSPTSHTHLCKHAASTDIVRSSLAWTLSISLSRLPCSVSALPYFHPSPLCVSPCSSLPLPTLTLCIFFPRHDIPSYPHCSLRLHAPVSQGVC